jgi:hypothetical protein
MRTGEGRIIGMKCIGCLKAFHYYPHTYCYEIICMHNNPIVYKPSGIGEELKKKDARREKSL